VSAWYPDRLMVANLYGRALISDTYIMGEWRGDPWKGFDMPEGAWVRTKWHEYEPSLNKTQSVAWTRRMFSGVMPKRPPRRTFELSRTSITMPAPRDVWERQLELFDGGTEPLWVSRALCQHLIRIIDGPPAAWRGDGEKNPIYALDEKGHELGAIMPVIVPKVSTKETVST
jgi:hypothetical protein